MLTIGGMVQIWTTNYEGIPMATIDKRVGLNNKATFRVRVRVHGQIRTATFDRKTDAKSWASTTESELRHGKRVPTSKAMRRTVTEMIDRYLEEILPYKRRNKSQSNTERHLKWWKEQIGSTLLYDLDPDLIIQCRNKLLQGITHYEKPRSPSTCNRYTVSFSHVCRIAFSQWCWLSENPLSRVEKLREPKGRTRFLNDAERTRLLDACRNSRNKDLYTIVVLALSTGMRRGEIISLKWSNVSIHNARIVLHETKNGETRVVPLTGHAYDLMRDKSKIRHIKNTLVFPGKIKGQVGEFRDAWHNALTEAKIDHFRFHDLRHTAASYLAMNGATLSELAEILGHKTLSMVKRYSHFTEQHTSKVVERMNNKMFGGE